MAALCCWSLFYAFPVYACGPYQVAYYEFGALYYWAEQGETGIDKDMIDELGRRTGCRFIGSVDSRVRIWTRLEAGVLDMTVSGIPTADREKFATFIPYLHTRNYVLLQPELLAQHQTLEAFLNDSKLVFGVVKSFRHGKFYDDLIESLRKQGRVIETADYPSLLRIFLARRVSAILGLPTSLGPVLASGKISTAQLMDWSQADDVTGALVLSRQRVSVKDAELMRAAMQGMRDDGTLERIYRRHLPAEIVRLIRVAPVPLVRVAPH